jgi:hypothetical protein
MVDGSAVELSTVSVGNAHSISPGTQLGARQAKLVREAVSLIDRDFCVFEDHDALIFELFVYDEIKTEVGHCSSLHVSGVCAA